MAKIMDHLSQGEILAQMAEELAEADIATAPREAARLRASEPTRKELQNG